MILNEFLDGSNKLSTKVVAIARIYLALGQKEQALEWLEKGLPDHTFGLIHLNEHPGFNDLRTEPRFIELIKKIGFKE